MILCIGDIVDWGFHPHEVIAWLKEHGAICVCGNHDRYLAQVYDTDQREEIGKETNYTSHCINQMTPEDARWLSELPETRALSFDGIPYCLRHTVDFSQGPGAITLYHREYRSSPMFKQLWNTYVGEESGERRIIFGHSHMCYVLRAGAHQMYLNPGSVHYRLGGDAQIPGADYMVIEDGVPMLRHMDFPTKHLRQLIKDSNFDEGIKTPALVYAGSAVD